MLYYRYTVCFIVSVEATIPWISVLQVFIQSLLNVSQKSDRSLNICQVYYPHWYRAYINKVQFNTFT